MFCKFCGHDLEESFKFCDKCGKPVDFTKEMCENETPEETEVYIRDMNEYNQEQKKLKIKLGIISVFLIAAAITVITISDKQNIKNREIKNKEENAISSEVNEENKTTSSEKMTEEDSEKSDPKNHKLYNSAVQLMNSECFEEALKSFNIISEDGYDVDDEIAECTKHVAEFTYKQADGYYQTERYAEALELFELISGYSDSDEKAEICRAKIEEDTNNITPDDPVYYFGRSLSELRDYKGDPDQNPRFRPLSASIGGYANNSYKYNNALYSYIDFYSNLESRIFCISLGEGEQLNKNIKVGMTFKELSKFLDFDCGSPLEMQIEPVSRATAIVSANGYDCEIDVDFPLGADIDTPSEKILIHNSDIAEEEYDIQRNNPTVLRGAVKAYSKGSVVLNDPTSTLNIRSGPGTDYDIIGELHNGDVIFWLYMTDDWIDAETEYGNGYVRKDFIQVID